MANRVLVLGEGGPCFRHDVVGDLIKQGRCPNGCGLMAVEGKMQRCPECRFVTNEKPDPLGKQ